MSLCRWPQANPLQQRECEFPGSLQIARVGMAAMESANKSRRADRVPSPTVRFAKFALGHEAAFRCSMSTTTSALLS